MDFSKVSPLGSGLSGRSLGFGAAAACFTGGLATGLIMSKLIRDKKFLCGTNPSSESPEKWIKVGNITEMTIYPVKSLPGIKVEEARATILGLQGVDNPALLDRTFVITNAKGDFQTMRAIQSFAHIRTAVEGNVLKLTYIHDDVEDEISVEIPKDGDNKSLKKKMIRIWWDKVEAFDCGDHVASWLDKVNGLKGLRLFFYDNAAHMDRSFRTVHKDEAKFPMFSQKDMGTFHDETSYMLMTEESMTELNRKLGEEGKTEMSHRAFRPSLLIRGSPAPWAEDVWSYIRIGDSSNPPIFKTSRPCQRCKMTTIDPDTGLIREDGEPLITLRKIKRPVGDAVVTKIVDSTAVMGTHFGMLQNPNGVVRIGDPVYAAAL